MKRIPLVITHGSCFDGMAAAWAFHRLRGDAEFVYAHHGDAPPDTSDRDVYVCDFSYPRETMMKMIVASHRTVVLDHHQTAQDALQGIIAEMRVKYQVGRENTDVVIFDMNRSGAGITWDYLTKQDDRRRGFHNPQSRPWLINYIEDRDLWRFKLDHSREVAAWISTVPMTLDAYEELSNMEMIDVAQKGRGVLRYIDQYGEKACAHARNELIAGFRVPTINVAYMNCSEHVNKLLMLNPDSPFAAGYFRRGDGRWQFSLRSRPSFDVSNIAKTFGGGGHAQAAGFEVDKLPWEEPVQPIQAPGFYSITLTASEMSGAQIVVDPKPESIQSDLPEGFDLPARNAAWGARD